METEYICKDTDLGEYYQYPKWLDDFALSRTAEKMYVRLLDRARISAMNDRYMDERGNLYVLYTYRSLCSAMNRKETCVKMALAELEGTHLITRQRQGIGQPNKIFLKIPIGIKKTINKAGKSPSNGQETDNLVGEKVPGNKTSTSKTRNSNSRKQNRFINYTQSSWDFDAIAAMERERVMKDIAEMDEKTNEQNGVELSKFVPQKIKEEPIS